MKQRHFESFDAVRFFACLKVFLLHIPVFVFPVFSYLKQDGGVGVEMFFVLSGFLISYAIFTEKDNAGAINLKNFYFRRMLRIVPLYYLMIMFAFCTPYVLKLLHLHSSKAGYEPNWLISFLFLENYKIIFEHCEPNVAPLNLMWSLCVEMHFYLIWGLIVYLVRMKKLPIVFIIIIILSNISRYIFYINNLITSDILTNFDSFIFGAIPAYCLVKYKDKMDKWINDIPLWIKYASLIVVIVLLCLLPLVPVRINILIMPTVWGISFAWILTILSPCGSNFGISDRSVFSKLGKYTYGFYLFQSIWMIFLLKIFENLNLTLNNPWLAFLYIILSFFCTLLTSWVSYNYIERPFLRLKRY